MRYTIRHRRLNNAVPASLLACALASLATAAAVLADPPTPTATPAAPTVPSPAASPVPPESVIKVKATQKPKDVPQSNASQTVVSSPAIEHADPDLTLPQIIARFVPGASGNPDNGLRIRGADDQFETYLDGVPVPQSVSGSITDVLDPRDIQSLRVYTGGFPAEFAGQLSAVFAVTTQSGSQRPSGTISQSAASASSYVTRGSYSGSDGNLRYFVTGSTRQTNFFLNPPTQTAAHDDGHEDHGLLKLDYDEDSKDRLMLLVGSNGSDFENPGTPDTQQESGVLAHLVWNHVAGLADTRVALYTHASSLKYNGSPADYAVDGSFETNQNQRVDTTGIRADQTWAAGATHLFKAGLDIARSTVSEDFSITLPGDGGNLTDDSSPHAWDLGLYVQDDWTPGRFLINYGARFDRNSQDTTTSQVSPRVNVKYRLDGHNIVHAYYDRLFQPIPAEDAAHLVGNAAVGDNGTLSPLQPERDDFYEVGIDHAAAAGTSIGLAAYYKSGRNVRDDDQVGNTNITLPVDDAKAFFRGVEFTVSRDFRDGLDAFGNLALSWNKNAGPITGGQNEGGVSTAYFYDDHDQTYTSTFGLAYDNRITFADLTGEYGSGQPYGEIDDSSGDPVSLNYLRVPSHLLFDVDLGRRLSSGFAASVFADNLFNDAYLIKQVTAFSNTQYAEGRIVGIRLSQDF